MANSLPIRTGQNLNTGPVDALYLPVYGGEVLSAFEEMTVAKNLVRQMTMTVGNEMKFPRIHKFNAERHAAGAELLGDDTTMGEQTISLDERPLVAHFDLDDVDQAMAHYEVRSEIAKQAGRALAREMDKNVLQLIVKASRTAASSPFDGGGYQANAETELDGTPYEKAAGSGDGQLPTNATDSWTKPNALTILHAIEDIVIGWDERDIPQEERYCVVPTSCWHLLRNLGLPEAFASNSSTVVGYNPFSDGTLPQGVPADADASRAASLNYLGVNIVRSNFLPKTDITTGEGKYQGDFTKTRALCVQKEAVGVLTLMGVQTETDRDVRRQTDFFVTKMLYGGGTLRPECAVEIARS